MEKEEYKDKLQELEKKYKDKLQELEKKYKKEKNSLYIEFAMSNNDIKIGDVFTDHIGSIKVEKISVHIDYNQIPKCVYFGVELKKDGTPIKKGTKRFAYQTNKI